MDEIVEIKPVKGEGILHSHDDGLVAVNRFTGFPAGRVKTMDYGIIFICTSGMAQFEYDGQTIQLNQNDVFLYFVRSVVENFLSSADFSCRQIWFSRGELWDMNMYGKNSLSDLVTLKRNPKVALSPTEYAKMDTYFQLICQNMAENDDEARREITHSLFSTFLLETLSLLRRESNQAEAGGSEIHGKMLADKFMELLEQSDGHIRRVSDVAQMLNVTPKYLSKLLMKTMNRTPSDMVTFFTLKAIENRLRFTDMTMQQIADELGFSSASSFGKFFREHQNMTPLEYRKQYHGVPTSPAD